MTLGIALSAFALGLGATIQAITGYGCAVVALPVLALAVPRHMPQVLVLDGSAVCIPILLAEWRHVDGKAVPPLAIGEALGAAAGIGVLQLVPAGSLRLVFAACALLALIPLVTQKASMVRTPNRSLAAGTAAGVMGTVSGMSGPPLAVLFAREHGPTVRATVTTVFCVGSCFSITGLALTGRIDVGDLTLAAAFLVPIALGFVAGRLALGHVRDGPIHALTVGIILMSGMILLVGKL